MTRTEAMTKINKLLALANDRGATEAEKATALKMAKSIAEKHGINIEKKETNPATSYNFTGASTKSDNREYYRATFEEKWVEVQEWLIRSFSLRFKSSQTSAYKKTAKAKPYMFKVTVTREQELRLRALHALMVKNYKQCEKMHKEKFGTSSGFKQNWFAVIDNAYRGQIPFEGGSYLPWYAAANILGKLIDKEFSEVK